MMNVLIIKVMIKEFITIVKENKKEALQIAIVALLMFAFFYCLHLIGTTALGK